MPDPNENAGATAPATSVPAAAASSPSTQGSQPATSDNIAHVSDEDFAHPIYGPKLKSLYTGLQEKGTKLSEAEKKYQADQDYAARAREAFSKISASKELADQVRAVLSGTPVTTPAEKEEEEPHIKAARNAKEEALAEIRAELAMRDTLLEMGGGDFVKGRAAWDRDHDALNRIMETISNGDAKSVLSLAVEVLSARAAKAAPSPAPAPTGTAAVETERGTGGATPPSTGHKDEDILRAMLNAAGVSSPAEFAAAQGAFGR